ncbi:transcription termination factor NusA [Alphaproteobacteria bacterium]|jgi:N utilization substance protein A|nr:transcription termination factor NusA [Alphaproteobacteria bacterium]|tara:strand:+ start:615 stop:2135 length:1521 start_codon:yes stop_codon:yes gene_type:complete
MELKSIPRLELIQVAEAVSREKSIEKEEVILAMEEAIQKAARSKYGIDRDIRANIDRKNGAIVIAQYTEVVEAIDNEAIQMSFQESERRKLNLSIGDFYKETLPQIDFGRIAAQTAKQVISQKVREAERQRQFQEYKDRIGEIVIGTIKRVESHSITIDLGRAEATIKKDQMIPREQLRPGDRLRSYIIDVREEVRGPQIFLSRSCNEFLAALFTQEVPEIYDGIIEIKGVAREPGSRAKITAFSNDPSIDPVGACVGMRGSRVQAVVGELQGEKIEIIPWSEDPVTFVINALAPAVPSKVVMDEDAVRMEVVVPDDQLSLAIGRRGQNVRLASQLTNWYVDILTEAEESERRQEEFSIRTKIFIEALDIDDVIAHLMVGEGFVSIEDIADASLDELKVIEGFDIDIASELSERAKSYMKIENERVESSLKKLKVSDDLYNFDKLSKQNILVLAENEIKTLDDLAELDSEELYNILGKEVFPNEEVAGSVIMSAREHWFSDENLNN